MTMTADNSILFADPLSKREVRRQNKAMAGVPSGTYRIIEMRLDTIQDEILNTREELSRRLDSLGEAIQKIVI